MVRVGRGGALGYGVDFSEEEFGREYPDCGLEASGSESGYICVTVCSLCVCVSVHGHCGYM